MQLTHDQIGFLRETLAERLDKAIGDQKDDNNPMVNAYLEGVVDDAAELLGIIGPCSTVTVAQD